MNNKSPEELNARIADLESNVRFLDNTAERWRGYSMALEADRKKLEAEVRRLMDEAGRKSPWPAGCHQSAEEQMATRIYGRKDRFGDGEGLTVEAQRACARRELEMTAHGMEEKSMAAYWQDKYHELKRLKAMEDKVAADQVASLQGKLEAANDTIRGQNQDYLDLKAQLEGARARVLQEVQEHLEAWEGKDHFSESPLFRKSMAEIGEEILAINRGNGWDVTQPSDWPSTPEDVTSKVRKLMTNLALIHSEVSEASEAVRKLDRRNFEEELADVIIRTLDTSHGLGIDLGPVICAKLKKNRGRGHKHGGKAI